MKDFQQLEARRQALLDERARLVVERETATKRAGVALADGGSLGDVDDLGRIDDKVRVCDAALVALDARIEELRQEARRLDKKRADVRAAELDAQVDKIAGDLRKEARRLVLVLRDAESKQRELYDLYARYESPSRYHSLPLSGASTAYALLRWELVHRQVHGEDAVDATLSDTLKP